MRIADKMAYDQVDRSLTKNRGDMATLQNQAATQKRVNKPSDDPIAAARVLGKRVDLHDNEQYIKNLNYAKGFLDYSEQSLGDVTDLLVRAKEIAISQANDASSSSQTRRSAAAEIRQLHDHAVQVANRKLGERFIFGGFKTTASPFDERGNYLGDEGEMKIHVDKDAFLSMNIPGSYPFSGKNLSKDGFAYHSANQPTTVQELKALEALKPEQFEPVPDQPKPLPQNGPEMRGPASLRTTEEIAPLVAENVAPPKEKFNPRDGVNLFDSLKKLEISLMADDKYGIQESLDRLDDGMQQVIVARSALGAKASTIDGMLRSMGTDAVDQKRGISELEDADTFKVISDMNRTESALQASLQTSGKLLQKSLMDFVQV